MQPTPVQEFSLPEWHVFTRPKVPSDTRLTSGTELTSGTKLTMMLSDAVPHAVYTQRLAERRQTLAALETRQAQISSLRLAVSAVAMADLWFIFRGPLPGWTFFLPVLVFIAMVWRQSRIERDAARARRAIRFYERGIQRMEDHWHDSGETGQRFSDPKHPYAADLDLFGRASLFQLLNAARTHAGEARLAEWLKQPAPAAEIRARHQAITELRPLLDLREELAVLGDDFRTGVHPDALAQWGATAPRPFPAWQRIAAFLLSLFAGITLLWWFGTAFLDVNATRAIVAVAFAAAALAVPHRARVLGIVSAIQAPAHDLDLLSGILAILEKQQFQSPKLAALRSQLAPQGQPASSRIARLRRLVELLDSRDSILVRMFGPILLWTTQLAMALEAWRCENGALIAVWLDAVAEMEALSSLAGYASEHPSDPFPEIAEGVVLRAQALSHPLLPESRAVPNDLELGSPLRLLLVSGSNMSGKSTLLRAVGVNAVLAWAGAPVRARQLVLSPMALGASIRTMDSLEEGHSRFMAEILRLKQILDLPNPSLFLLDELLHGTNSHDRAIGAAGLLRALLAKGAVGIATTHDLALTRVASDLSPSAGNFHFDDHLEDHRLVFDYKLKPGVVERSNALDLMRAIGLEI